MEKINVAISGLPGKMATLLAERLVVDERFHLLSSGLTGPDVPSQSVVIGEQQIHIYPPKERQMFLYGIQRVKDTDTPIFVADFSQPDAVISNAEFYAENGLPFVMGTTGCKNLPGLEEIIRLSEISAVVAPNMAAQVVALQAAIEYMANNFPDAFDGFEMEIRESHQQGKIDTSGTAKALIPLFNKLGVPFEVGQIKMIRKRDEQLALGVAEEHLGGHGWHTYDLKFPDGTMQFTFVHNVSGRRPYVEGTLKALSFLAQKITKGEKGRVFSMIDVLKGK